MKRDPRFTPRILPDDGSVRFTVLPFPAERSISKASVGLVTLNKLRSEGSHANAVKANEEKRRIEQCMIVKREIVIGISIRSDLFLTH